MNNLKYWLGSIGAAAVVSFLVVFFMVGGSSHKFGGTTIGGLATWANYTSGVSAFTSVEADLGLFDAAGAVSNFLGSLAFSSNTTTSGVAFQGSAGTCATATSTLFAVKSPFAATSTARIWMSGVGNATSTNLLVGTSTTATGLVASSVSASFANMTIGTSSPTFNFASGVTAGSVGYTSPGSGSMTYISVGPNDYVAAEATSTYGGAGAVGCNPSLTSCTYEILWNK